MEPFTLYDVLENEYQWRQFLNGKVVSGEFGKLLDRMTAYRVKERPNSVTEILRELEIRQKTKDSSFTIRSTKRIDQRQTRDRIRELKRIIDGLR